jgi:biotin synthase
MGETDCDRIDLLHTLANLTPQPESVPINALSPVAGTPFGDLASIDPLVLVRMVSTARILMPKAVVRLSAGRDRLSVSDQALCFLAGANSIFSSEKLLTTANPDWQDDAEMFQKLGVKPKELV